MVFGILNRGITDLIGFMGRNVFVWRDDVSHPKKIQIEHALLVVTFQSSRKDSISCRFFRFLGSEYSFGPDEDGRLGPSYSVWPPGNYEPLKPGDCAVWHHVMIRSPTRGFEEKMPSSYNIPK